MRVVVSGASGLIGGAVARRLEADGHQVSRLTRSPASAADISWDPAAGQIDSERLEGHDAVVHLAGEPLAAERWNAAHKARIFDSRVAGTNLLTTALAGLASPPHVIVSGSAVGYYGSRGDEILTEDSGPGSGFLADVVKEWEAATAPAEAAGIRVAHIRTGLVMSADGGALGEVLTIFKLGLGGKLASGDQWWPWISIDDEVAAVMRIIDDDTISGAVNLCGPQPVTNAEFTKTLGRVLGRPALFTVPRVALALRFGPDMVEDMLMASQRAVPERLQQLGFQFQHQTLEQALRDILDRPS